MTIGDNFIDYSLLEQLRNGHSDVVGQSLFDIDKFSGVLDFFPFDSDSNQLYRYIEQTLFSQNKTSFIVNVQPLSDEEFKIKNRALFLNIIKYAKFEDGEYNAATDKMKELLEINKDMTMTLLQEYFLKGLEEDSLDEVLLTKILSLLGDYDYEYLRPYSQLIAASAYSVKSIKVVSAVFRLLGHWGSQESLSLLKKYQEPIEPWLNIKYKRLLSSLEKRCTI